MKHAELFTEFSPPSVSEAEATWLLEEFYGLSGRLSALGGERDQNCLAVTGCGQKLVLKISGLAESRDAIDFQAELLDHLERVAPELAVPKSVRTKGGELYFQHEFEGGQLHTVRVVTFVDGQPLPPERLRSDHDIYALGHLQGRICRALASFTHPAARRQMPWDMCNGLAFDHELLSLLDPETGEAVMPHVQRLQDETLPALLRLRSQVIHNDVHAGNVLINTSGEIAGLIDFGDALFAPLLQELAVSAVSLAETGPDEPGTAIGVLERGFHDAWPLLPEERELLLDAALLRSLLCVELSHFKIHKGDGSKAQAAVHAASRRGLLALCQLIAARGSRSSAAGHTLARRKKAMSPTYKHHYETPMHFVRGRGTTLTDATGRDFLDCYNNVPSVGHCHPRVVAALERQAATLNTHTRYLHEEIVRYSERLLATLPDELDTCMFVCTGSEANDLAYQIARTVTGKTGAVVANGAYHGNSIGSAAVSVDYGGGEDYPDYVAPIPLPDCYRGGLDQGEPEPGPVFAARSEPVIADMASSQHGLAMFMVDTIFDNPGIFTAPPGYLSGVFDLVRAAGGLVVADEVQAGLCRLGDHYWGFQDSGVVPDIVTMGKPLGNGHPLAVVAAKREVLDAFASRAHYFNTFGGNPVSAAVGNTVLDVIEDERILENVHEVGRHLMSGLHKLRGKHEIIGDIRGKGLFVGVDLVAGRTTRAPWSAAAHEVVNGLCRQGVLTSVNGCHDNVIKIRPPLVFSRSDADRLLEILDNQLSQGVAADLP